MGWGMEHSEHGSGSQEFLSTSSPGRQFRHQQRQEWGVRIKVVIPKIIAIVAGGDEWMGVHHIRPVFLKVWPQASSTRAAWNLLEMHIPPEPRNQKFWGWGQAIWVPVMPPKSENHSPSLSTFMYVPEIHITKCFLKILARLLVDYVALGQITQSPYPHLKWEKY